MIRAGTADSMLAVVSSMTIPQPDSSIQATIPVPASVMRDRQVGLSLRLYRDLAKL
jgi:hypothetical protein